MKRFTLLAALAILLCCTMLTQAQQATPTFPPSTGLAPGSSKRGVLPKLGDSTTLGFSVPALEEMVVRVTADKVVVPSLCVEIDGPPICPPGGGGGDGDTPTSYMTYVPSSDKVQTIDLSLYRPLDGAANYQIETFAVTPTRLGLDESRTVSDTNAKSPYASYLLNVNPAQSFVIEIEDAQGNGDFLWVAHHPFVDANFKASDVRQTFPQRIDAADREDNPKGVSSLELYYLGGNEFRVLVTSNGTFLLNSRSMNVQPLDAGVTLPLTISYRNPLAAVRLNVDPGDVAKVDFQIPQGSRAVAEVYQEGGSIGDSLELGYNSNQRVAAPSAGTIHEVATARPLYALVQLGDGSTRDPLRVTLGWTKEQ